MPTALLTIAEDLAPALSRWKSDFDPSWRILTNYVDDSLYLATETSSWPFLDRDEIDSCEGRSDLIDERFSDHAMRIMKSDQDIRSRLRGKTYAVA